jgi:type I restriction enzyme R subunit
VVPQPEQHARGNIDTLLAQAGWQVCDPQQVNLTAGRGIAIREFPLPGHGVADYLLYINGKAAGVIEAKKEGVTLTGVETQAEKYTKGLPNALPRWSSPLPFSYQSTGIETRFTNGLDPAPRSRPVFAFHKPEALAESLEVGRIKEQSDESANAVADATATYNAHGQTFLGRLQHMPALKEEGLWPAQITAIRDMQEYMKYYDSVRLRSTLGYRTPMEYEHGLNKVFGLG